MGEVGLENKEREHTNIPNQRRPQQTSIKGIRDAGSTADFRILFEIFEILEIFDFFETF